MDFLLYLDELLLRGIFSITAEGYIEIFSRKRICDKSLTGRLHCENKESDYYEDRFSKDKREGYKGYTNSDANTRTVGSESDEILENRGAIRIEEEEKRIYTLFSFHNKLINNLSKNNQLKTIQNLCNDSIIEGDYISLNGLVCHESLYEYISSLKLIIDCFGVDKLNSIRKGDSIIDFNVIDRFLSEMQSKLSANNTTDLIVQCNNRDVILTVNNSYFFNNNSNKFDNIDCNVNILGKLVKKCSNNNNIHFLRKTGQQSFNEQMLAKCIKEFDCLLDIGIVPPKCPRIKCTENSFQVIPISMYI